METAVGKGVKYAINGNIMTVTIDLAADFGRSKTGKTTIIASTEGNVRLGDTPAVMGLNVYRK